MEYIHLKQGGIVAVGKGAVGVVVIEVEWAKFRGLVRLSVI